MDKKIVQKFEGIRCKIVTSGGLTFTAVTFQFVADDSDLIEFYDSRYNSPVTMSCNVIELLLSMDESSALKKTDRRVK